MPPPLPSVIGDFLNSASLDEKHHLLTVLTQNIADLEAGRHSPPRISPDPKSFVEHVEDLEIDPELSAGVQTELESLKLISRASKNKKAKVKTQWLSPSEDSYNYANVVNKPKPISSFPHITRLMELANSHNGSTGDMDSCLVSCFSTSKAALSLHSDNEDLISQSSSICTVTFGAPRSLDFVSINKGDRRGTNVTEADFTLPATHHSMNIMKPGCQSVLKHRITAGIHVPNTSSVRYSLSFRKIIPKNLQEDSPPKAPSHKSSPNAKICPPLPPPQKPSTPNRTGVYLMAGDSFFERLDTGRLSKGDKKKVYNIAKGGTKIDAVLKSIQDFVAKNPSLDVKKLFVSIGTNDIRNCANGIEHLKNPVKDFMKAVRDLLPTTAIFLQSLLPIASNGNAHSDRNVETDEQSDI